MEYTTNRISFDSSSVACAGYLYVPAGAIKAPCVILAHGFSGTMDWVVPQYAEEFAKAGFAALIFDYRTFGESAGEPRQLIDIHKQREDIRAAIGFVRSQPMIDPARLALWGTSLGGGHVFYIAATDPGIAAVIAQVPGFDMVRREARATIKIPVKTVATLLLAAAWDALRGAVGVAPYYVRVFGNPGELAVFTDQNLKPRFDRLEESSRHWRNRVTPRFFLTLPTYKNDTATKLQMPLLVCVATRDVYANPTFQVLIGRRAKHGQVLEYDAEHFDFYHHLFAQVVADQIAFLKNNL
jgi:dienelactone hydrolase